MGNASTTSSTRSTPIPKMHRRHVKDHVLSPQQMFCVVDTMTPDAKIEPDVQLTPSLEIKSKIHKRTKSDHFLVKRAKKANFLKPFSKGTTPHLHKKQENVCRFVEDLEDFETAVFNREKDFVTEVIRETGNSDSDVIFDSRLNGMDQRELKAQIIGKEKLLFVFVSKMGDVFGFYQKSLVCPQNNQNVLNATSDNFMLFGRPFSWEDPIFIQKKETKMNEEKKTFVIHQDTHGMLLSCFSAFWVGTNGNVNFNVCAKSYYEIPQTYTNPFTGKSNSEKVVCEKIVVLKCF
ncbi:hypothetical protein EIN_356980 [Entamoeba invadens IP1]|uniref:TLDc domain-containing protein n=1 Tax=Entamoeba invadens IP1 TaxID=370355 RepID=L7FLR1_ENTIV|nr:hypothetical protein EIN_356980 [Entamoeba invadens IP1]ELP88915.1 hypothetical protein EIN_356980 [Entamoeba invadens IP1]|eukprot:XP_004255686.1 hypothetical protein EIN_356980 [Entamoeba invadens IP1]